ncbi:MAG: hypothetical protein AB1898_18105 [Acidobacteriota bacterium]
MSHLRLLMGGFILLAHSAGEPSLVADDLKAAAAKITITPPVGRQLWGLASRSGPSTGTLDPLFARILVLRSGSTSLAIVAMDLGRTFDVEQMAEARAQIKLESGIEHVIFAASHTHNGPTPLNKKYFQPGTDRWETKALGDIVRAVGEAGRRLVSCRIASGKGSSSIGHNRQDPVGGLWTNEIRFSTFPTDPIVQILRVETLAGEPITVLVNYAAHPVVLDSDDSTQYSADFPGVMAETVEKNLPGSPVCLFIQGACGDINSRYVGQYFSFEKGPGVYGVLVREMRQLGRELGHEVLRVLKGLQAMPQTDSHLAVQNEEMVFRARWDLAQLKAQNAVPTYHQWVTEGRPIGFPAEELKVFITTAVINRQVAILTMPGEAFVEFQLSFRNRLPGLDTILAGYSNGYVGYIPTIRIAARDGVVYGANAWPTILEVGAGERIVDRGVIAVHRMLGRLKDQPDPAGLTVPGDGLK